MRSNSQNGTDPIFDFGPGTNGDRPSASIWRRAAERGAGYDQAMSGNGWIEHANPVPAFDWHVSEALMKCYNG